MLENTFSHLKKQYKYTLIRMFFYGHINRLITPYNCAKSLRKVYLTNCKYLINFLLVTSLLISLLTHSYISTQTGPHVQVHAKN